MVLAIILVLLSIVSVVRPWAEVDPKVENAIGWPSQFTHGLTYGVDLIGGSRIMLRLEAYHVTIELRGENIEQSYANIHAALENNLHTSVTLIDFDRVARKCTIEIGVPVSEILIENLIDNYGTAEPSRPAIQDETRNDVMEYLRLRVDPYGTLGAIFRPVGANFILYEIAGLTPEEAEARLGQRGQLEIYLENEVILRGEQIDHVDAPTPDLEDPNTANLPFRLNDEGARSFSEAAAGKANYPTVVYIDRPRDAIIVFDDAIPGKLGGRLVYDPDENKFKAPGLPSEGGGYFLEVPAVGTAKDTLSSEAYQFLDKQKNLQLRVLTLGDFSSSVIDNIARMGYSIENVPRPSGGVVEWIKEACGCKSVIIITPSLAAEFAQGKILKDLSIEISRSSSEEAMAEARNLRIILSQQLPVEISYEGETAIDPRLGAGFMQQILLAGLVALVAIGVLVYLRYRHVKISVAIMGTMICELIITLGVASILPYNLDLPELGGIIIIIGTGIDQQIIITDELLRGELPKAKHASLKGRIGRAFRIIWGSAFTTLAAMVSLALLGFGVMRGFALITILGLLVAVLVTRPAYARVARAIVAGVTSPPSGSK